MHKIFNIKLKIMTNLDAGGTVAIITMGKIPRVKNTNNQGFLLISKQIALLFIIMTLKKDLLITRIPPILLSVTIFGCIIFKLTISRGQTILTQTISG